MADMLELSYQYRISGLACKNRLKELKAKLENDNLRQEEIIELRRSVTMLTAMTRDCLATSNYLKRYHERREWLERHRKETGV